MRNNEWLELSGDLFLFGPGGITRVATVTGFNPQTQQPVQYTQLFEGTKPVAEVKETVAEIGLMLGTAIIFAPGRPL